MKSIYVDCGISQEEIIRGLRDSNTSTGVVITAKDNFAGNIKLVFFIDGDEQKFLSHLPKKGKVDRCEDFSAVKNGLAAPLTEISKGVAGFTVGIMHERKGITNLCNKGFTYE